MRYTVDPHTLTVIDNATNARIVCSSLEAMMRLRSEMELAEMPAPRVSKKKAQRLAQREERRQGGQR